MKSRWLSPWLRRLALREWLALFIAMLLLAGGLGWLNGLGRIDQTLYDQFVAAHGRPARDDIIIVAIDDYSLAELGRWPWPRALHAQLIDRLSKARPRAIGLDVILSEPEQAQADGGRPGDRALARALAAGTDAVLPLTTTDNGAGLVAKPPIAELAGAAHALGHIDLEQDNDGVVRSVFLREGRGGVWWPHFALALAGAQPTASATNRSSRNWQRTDQMHIAFAGNSGHFKSIPYVSVLRGEVADQFFTDKYVLVGATAPGMTDSYPTPMSGQSGAMSGIEINANILAGLLDHQAITLAQPWQTACFSVLPVLIALIGYFFLSPRKALLMGAALLLLTVALSYLALRDGIWIAPSAAVIALAVSYPLWSWRRLEAAIAYLGQEFIRLDREPHLLPEAAPAGADEQIEDVLERRISAMKNAARRVRDLRQFVSDSLDNLPDATLVTDTEGRVLLANRHAHHYLSRLPAYDLASALADSKSESPCGTYDLASALADSKSESPCGKSVYDVFAQLHSPQPVDQAANARFDWDDLLQVERGKTLANGVAVRDEQGRDLLLKSAPCHAASGELTGWIVSVVDISTIRQVERSRDETLRFLSHDMRAPQASILAMLELQQEPSSAIAQPEFFSRIEKAARKTLGLADNFVQLSRAESHEYRLEEVDFQDLLFDATDEMWSLSTSKQIAITADIEAGEYPVQVDRALVTRALTNLLSNGINYSPENTRIVCSVRVQHTRLVCCISDQGYGIAVADQTKLFRRFQRVDLPNQPRHEGIGLGLVFVKTVLERHQGSIVFSSVAGEGTRFTLTLPLFRPNPALMPLMPISNKL